MNPPTRGRRTAVAFGRVVALVALAAAAIWAMEPPTPRPDTAPPDIFSAARALVDIRRIAAEPHPPGSDAHAQVRDYLVERLRALGWPARVERRTVVHARGDAVLAATVENVVADRPGDGPPLILTAHYDSHVTGGGAGDDASGVATLLETLRALGTAPTGPLRVLITDGEEYGLLGARAAVEAGTVAVPGIVLNFEARGGGGPVFMFETSDGNAALIDAFSGAPQPRASSLMFALYKTLPNDTDLTVFKEAGLAGLNFAFAGRWTRYHTALDTPENLDLRSVQQEGDAALALVRRLSPPGGRTRLARTDGADAVYFDLLGRVLVRYPVGWVWPLFGIAVLGFGVAVAVSRGEKGFGKALGIGIALGAVSVVLSGAFGMLFGMAIGPLRDGAPWRDPYGARWLEASLALLCAGSAAAVWLPALRKLPARPLALGALVWWGIALGVASRFLPGATYFFFWPFCAAVGALWTPRPAPALGLLAALVWAVVFVPVWHGLALLLGFGMPAVLGAIAGLGAFPLLVVFRGDDRPGWWTAKALLLLAAACALGGVRVPRAGPEHPRVSALLYLEDADTHEAAWVSTLPPDPWTGPLLGARPERRPGADILPWRGGTVFAGRAEPQSLPAPQVERVGASLRVDGGAVGEVALWSDGPVTGVRLDGKAVPLVDGRLLLRYLAPPSEPFSVEIDAAPGTVFHVQSMRWGLPPSAPPRPDGLIPAPIAPSTDVSLVRRTLRW